LPFHLRRERDELGDDTELIDGKGFLSHTVIMFAFKLVEQITMGK